MIPTNDAGGSDPNDPQRSLDPRTLSKACTTDADCMLHAVYSNCQGCCNEQAANRTVLEAKRAELRQACSAGLTNCTMICPAQFADCFNNECIACEGTPSTDEGIKSVCEMRAYKNPVGATEFNPDCSEQNGTGLPPYTVRVRSTTASSVTVEYVNAAGTVTSKIVPVTYAIERPTPGRCVKDECNTARVDVTFP